MKPIATLVLAVCLPLLAGCGHDDPAPASTDAAAPTTALGRTVARTMKDARRQLHEGDLSLNRNPVRIGSTHLRNRDDDDPLPAASITPQGDLVIAGQTLTRTEDERALARAYREAIIDVAERGMDLGVQGADLGMRAAREAITGLFSGNRGEVEARIDAEATTITAEAMKLCDRLPGLFQAQQALAAARPEFAPYARMTAADVKDCREDVEEKMADHATARHARRHHDENLDPAAEADAAAATGTSTDRAGGDTDADPPR